MHPPARHRRSRPATWFVGVAGLAIATVAVGANLDGGALAATAREAARAPAGTVLALSAFALAFVIRAAVWHRVLPELPLGQAWAAVHVALGANHVLPLRLGEPMRVVSAVRRAGVGVERAVASTVALRSADVLAMALIGWVVAPRVVSRLIGPWTGPLVVALGAGAVGGLWWLRRLARGQGRGGGAARLPALEVAAGATAAWGLESVLVWQCARWAGIDLDPAGALLVTAVSVTAQLAAVAPGGFGTYEAAAVAAYAALGFDTGPALAAALTAHALKTAYSLVAGGVAVVRPRPGLLGRFRLAPAAATADPPVAAAPGPVVLFLPARDEEEAVGAVVSRAPRQVCGRPVTCVVVDDGSTDRTGPVARAAGAAVVGGPAGGLGAAVRCGLAEARRLGAAAVAFCDADGEYAPEELERLVAPILAGEADYVVGSRFAGDVERMLPHRRVGNVVLTRLLSFVARRRITDGQSGYRALSAEAAAAAEVIHDFNYAQVLTLDLLAKGFRYAEVPISYRFRTTGRSYVRLLPYLRNVVPAVYRELNTA